MNITTDRLMLTEITWDDLSDIHYLHTIPEVDEFNTQGIHQNEEETKESMKPYVEAVNETPQSKYTWAIKMADTNEFVGLAGIKLSNDSFKIGELFYKFLPVHWGKGYATEVAKKIIEVGFNSFKLHRIQAGCAVENI
ncbi:GNAT family N-acetyltransferase [Labilibacter marinus]|uniref:GNAT family N-acetyltransferase n=1 Tax=Labilibacter marinus TaxID=1477105 RepID=UPI0009FB55F9|nr:GNAT family N-acetyltransferase [Labilibacter marinus]